MTRLACLVALIAALAASASAQERRRLDMPAGMVTAGAPVATEPARPPGISRMLEQPAESRVIASSGQPSPTRMPTVDVYNNLTRSTLSQMRDGHDPTLPSGELKGENRWTMPPSVGVVLQQPFGGGNGSVGLNAGPGVQPDGTTGGVSINARVRVPFGR